MKEYQVTLTNNENKYKPVSCIVKIDVAEGAPLTAELKKKVFREGVKKICIKHYWSSADLKRYGYTQGKVREWDRAKIEAENKANYWELKKQRFAEGTWKPSKADARKLALEELRKKNKEKA